MGHGRLKSDKYALLVDLYFVTVRSQDRLSVDFTIAFHKQRT